MSATAETGSTTPNISAAESFIARAFSGRPVGRILFVHVPDTDSPTFNYTTGKLGRYYNFPPYGLGLLAEESRQRGIEVDLINLNNEVLKACRLSESPSDFDHDGTWQVALQNAIEGFHPDLMAFSCMFSQTHNSLVATCREARRLAPNVPSVVGGVHITNSLANMELAPKLLEDLSCVQFLFRFEGDNAFQVFLEVVDGTRQADQLAQIVLNEPSGPIDFTARIVPEGQILNTIPAHDLLRPEELSPWGKIGSFYAHLPADTRYSTVLSKRGCRAQCTFCSVRNFNGIGVRGRSVRSVVDELKRLRNDHGVQHIMWLDDDFLYDRASTLELFNLMIRENLGLTWDCTNGVIAASCTEEVISAAEAAGCIGLYLGMESGNRQILKQIRKPGTVENFLAAADVLQHHPSIHARVLLMIGFPGETYRQILDTIDISRAMQLDWYNVSPLQPLPNTPIFNQMVAQGYIREVDFSEMRFRNGAHGRNTLQVGRGARDLLSTDFKDAFSVKDLDVVPTKAALDDIWAYMNFHLNFNRLFFEERPMKLRQQIDFVGSITSIIVPENAIAIYFLGYLQHRLYGAADPELYLRLEERLQQSHYWMDRFREFHLSSDHLRTGRFQPQHFPLQASA